MRILMSALCKRLPTNMCGGAYSEDDLADERQLSWPAH